jgi:hypothetical protein
MYYIASLHCDGYQSTQEFTDDIMTTRKCTICMCMGLCNDSISCGERSGIRIKVT